MPPKKLESTEITNSYPNIEKLKEKYSPQKKIPPPSRGPSESFSKNYKVFATAPKRNSITINPRNMNSLEKKDLNISLFAPKMLASRNSSPEIRSDDSLGSNGPKRLSTTGGLSPIRRSGSPVRRRHISEIEMQLNQDSTKGNIDTHERIGSLGENIKHQEPHVTKRQRVSFNKEVEYNDTFTTSSLNDENALHTATIMDSEVRSYNNEKGKPTISEGPQEKVSMKVNSPNKNSTARIDRFMKEVDLRLKSLENTQKELLDILCKSNTELDTIDRINKLQESTIQLQNSLKRGT